MKKTISILTIMALVSAIGYNCSTKATDAKTEVTKSETAAVALKTPTEAAKLGGRVEHPAADFEKQTANGIVILDFFAVWCPPCKRFAPVFAKTAGKAVHADKLFIKIDIELFDSLTKKHNVLSMPTIIALKDGKEIKRNVGAMSELQFEKWLSDLK